MGSINLMRGDQLASYETFWTLADFTKMSEKLRIDENLQSLQYASLETLKKIFLQYRFFTHYYILDLATLISKLPFGRLKTILAEILSEELGSGDCHQAHPELYDDFLKSIGINHIDLNKPDSECCHYLQTIHESLLKQSWGYGVGLRGMGGECLCQIYLSTMYDYFSKNPAIIRIKDKIIWTFWEIHIGEEDLRHQEMMRSVINELIIQEPDMLDDLTQGYLESRSAWDAFWKTIFRKANIKEKANEDIIRYA